MQLTLKGFKVRGLLLPGLPSGTQKLSQSLAGGTLQHLVRMVPCQGATSCWGNRIVDLIPTLLSRLPSVKPRAPASHPPQFQRCTQETRRCPPTPSLYLYCCWTVVEPP